MKVNSHKHTHTHTQRQLVSLSCDFPMSQCHHRSACTNTHLPLPEVHPPCKDLDVRPHSRDELQSRTKPLARLPNLASPSKQSRRQPASKQPPTTAPSTKASRLAAEVSNFSNFCLEPRMPDPAGCKHNSLPP
ncbi:hypothetical protein BDP67DRAFT_145407 [Colletotrichum lupini]|nr:hypothetical protein BDP67DRAFT_145407 [Colletotrichum lupini]